MTRADQIVYAIAGFRRAMQMVEGEAIELRIDRESARALFGHVSRNYALVPSVPWTIEQAELDRRGTMTFFGVRVTWPRPGEQP
jgi:hypothetical protein